MLDTYRLHNFTSYNPHSFLGRHSLDEEYDVIAAYRPGFIDCYAQIDDELIRLEKGEQEGIFYEKIPKKIKTYKLYHTSGLLAEDPYLFGPVLSEVDQYLFAKGVHYKLYQKLGAHALTINGIKGVHFAVWAPSAAKVSLIADFNHFCKKTNPMRSLGSSGIWELFVPGLKEGEKYKFCITTAYGQELIKTDPMAHGYELRPKEAACVTQSRFLFNDEAYLNTRASKDHTKIPINCYELHLGSWKKGLLFKDAAFELAAYAKLMGYTHIQLLPILEHPLDESWGYQVTGFFAPSSRYGTLDDFKFFVNHLHQEGIGVIVDWVPAHFPSDEFALAKFDGTCLYEHQDTRKGFHPHWQTLIFNYGRHEVKNFLMASALFWLEECHVDGLRVDAVASMLYLDYGRKEGEWIPNEYGGKENLEAIDFIKHLNAVVHYHCPGVLMIAEESTSFCGVTHSLDYSGLGFDLKWNMGWMNDTLKYFSHDPLYRNHHHHLLTFGMIYAYSEKFQYVLSHDEVVHGKRSLLSKMPGDLWQKFANLRLLLAYMMTLPGKKLSFMGNELGDYEEWNMERSLSWHLLANYESVGIKKLVRDLNHLYLNESALHQKDHDPSGFEWVCLDDSKNSVLAFLRKSDNHSLLVVLNFTPQVHDNYDLYLPYGSSLKLKMNTDEGTYAGSNYPVSFSSSKWEHSDRMKVTLNLPPLACLIFDLYL